MRIRNARMTDLKNLAAVEAACFPPAAVGARKAAFLRVCPDRALAKPRLGQRRRFADTLLCEARRMARFAYTGLITARARPQHTYR